MTRQARVGRKGTRGTVRGVSVSPLPPKTPSGWGWVHLSLGQLFSATSVAMRWGAFFVVRCVAGKFVANDKELMHFKKSEQMQGRAQWLTPK